MSVFPDVPHYARSLYHGVIQPQSTSQHLNVSGFRPLIIFWSQYGNPNKAPDSPYTPNHVVPLVASEEGELVVTSPSGPSTEGVERSPQLLITTPCRPSTEGEVIAATIPTTNCNEHQGESSIEQNDRKIQSSWFTTYTWLQLEGGMFFL